MKSTTLMLITAALLLATTSLANAAAKSSQDGSQLAIYIFLGMCALIVIVQLFPMIFMLYGLVKGLIHGKRERAEVVNDK